MLPSEAPTTDNRLTRVEMAIGRIEGQVDQLVKEFAEFKTRVEAMIEDHQTALYGDKGKPGLVGQAGTLEELRVALKGYGKEPGLIAEIRDLSTHMREWDDTKKWMMRLVIGEMILAILAIVIKINR